jgi:hypothetical protein
LDVVTKPIQGREVHPGIPVDIGADRSNYFRSQDVVLALVLEKVAYASLSNSDILVSSRVVASARDPAEGVIFSSDNGNILGKQLPGVWVEHNIVVATHHLIEVLKGPTHHRIKGVTKITRFVE